MKKTSTGIKGLDDILGGGLPSGRCILVCGGPGSGKTILSVQFLYNGATKYDETGVYVALGESPVHLKEDLGGFGWDIEKLEKDEKFVILDASPLRTIPKSAQLSLGNQNFRMLSLVEAIKSETEKIGAKRVVIDSISSLILHYPDESERRNAVLDLVHAVTVLGATSIITTELRATALEREIKTEEFLSDGVIVFHTFNERGRLIRAIQIEKMRGVSHDHQLRPYKIYKDGIEIFSKESVLARA